MSATSVVPTIDIAPFLGGDTAAGRHAVAGQVAETCERTGFLIDQTPYAIDETGFSVDRGAREVWEIKNSPISMPHPMHVHGFGFRVLRRQGTFGAARGVTVRAIDALRSYGG